MGANHLLAQQYIDLLKKSLMGTLYPTVGMNVGTYVFAQAAWRRAGIRLLNAILDRLKLSLHHTVLPSEQTVREGRMWPAHALTMVGQARLDQLHAATETVLAEGIPGDLIETGVWRGGASILMRGVLFAHGVKDRRVFAADSFAGMPAPDASRYPADAGDVTHRAQPLAVPLDDVQANFARFSLLDEQVVFVPGWFEHTLAGVESTQFAIIRLDGDLYGSTMQALEALYPRLSPGGFCIVDDAALPPCRQAVDDYRARHGIAAPVHEIDWTGIYWRKA
jgi:O-methyltransferase